MFPAALEYGFAKNEFDPDFRFLPRFNVSVTTVKLLLSIVATFAHGIPLARSILTCSSLVCFD